MYWFWMNIPLAAVFVAAWTGVPLWLVLKHPDTRSEVPHSADPRQAQVAESAEPHDVDVRRRKHPSDSQPFAGAGR